MPNEFTAKELLYRGIEPFEEYISTDGTIHSSAFKCRRSDSGLSVDRQDGRPEETALEFTKSHLTHGPIATVTVQNVWECTATPKPDPIEDNPFHTQLYGNAEGKKLTHSQSKSLSRVAILVYDPR